MNTDANILNKKMYSERLSGLLTSIFGLKTWKMSHDKRSRRPIEIKDSLSFPLNRKAKKKRKNRTERIKNSGINLIREMMMSLLALDKEKKEE